MEYSKWKEDLDKEDRELVGFTIKALDNDGDPFMESVFKRIYIAAFENGREYGLRIAESIIKNEDAEG